MPVLANENTIEKVSIPNCNNSTKIANRWCICKLVQVLAAEISQIGLIKILSFSFLETYNVAVSLIHSLPNVIPSILRINSPNILVQDIPVICICHWENGMKLQ
jgi:hypothetical protein